MMQKVTELYKFKDWLDNETTLSESTINVYFYTLKSYLYSFDSMDLLDIDNMNWYLAKHSHKKRSTYMYSAIRKFIDFKTRNNAKIREEIYEKLLKPKRFKDIVRERKYLKDEKLIQILNNIEDETHGVIALLQMFTASRVGGILSIRMNGVSEEDYNGKSVLKLVTTEKGGKRNVVYIFDSIAIEIVKDYISKLESKKNLFFEDYIFLRHSTKRIGPDTLAGMKRMNYIRYWRELKIAIEKSGVVDKKLFATHDFRRCFSRKVWEKYKDVNVLQRVLNHEDPSTTLRYLKQSGLQNIDVFQEMQS